MVSPFVQHFWSAAYREDVLGLGIDPTRNVGGTLLVMVTLDTDLTDKNRFPDNWEGEPITYKPMPRPQAYGSGE